MIAADALATTARVRMRVAPTSLGQGDRLVVTAAVSPAGAQCEGLLKRRSVALRLRSKLAVGGSVSWASKIPVHGPIGVWTARVSCGKAGRATASFSVRRSPTPPPSAGSYFGTSASGKAKGPAGPSVATGLPRAATTCAARIVHDSTEVRPENTTANHTVGDGTYTLGPWATDSHWVARSANFRQVQGHFTGTTTEMFSWAGCRWGIDENTLRAVGVQESYWRISTVGDYCGKRGEGSYGLTQIKNATCDGQLAWGGYPDSTQSSAFDVDFYGAYLRSCYDGDFYDGGSYLYHGRTVAQIAATHGWAYVLWGCIGSWFSGGWYDSGAQTYIKGVKAHLANRDWEKF